MKEGICFGANITGAEGGSTTVVCDDLGNNFHYTLAEVDVTGAVVRGKGGRFQRVSFADQGDDGVEVYRGVSDNPVVKPGEQLELKVGSHLVTVAGEASRGVRLNGEGATRLTDELEEIRYPKPLRV